MTDKVQKIREEVEIVVNRRLNLLNGDYFNLDEETDGLTNEIMDIIDSLQEEPVRKLWHDASEKPNVKEKNGIFVITSLNGEYIGSRYYNYNDVTINLGNYDKWAYLNDLLNLSNVERTVKDWKEPVSKDLEEAANTYIGHAPEVDECSSVYGKRQAFKAGAEWQKENLWKSADGDDLPKIDREVIALLDNGKVVFAHRPPEYWDGKDIDTGKVTRYYPKTYDKGGWNIPDVKYWLDCLMPKEIEL